MKSQKRWIKYGFCVLAMSLTTNIAWGAKMRAKCYLLDREGQSVQGVDIHRAYEIASVSKIFTSYWATATKGINYRFTTKIYVTKVSNSVVNLHIEGGWDPYFNRDELQYLMAQLNVLNVTKIQNLSFDENFKFLIDSRGTLNRNVPVGHYGLDDPTPNRVLQNLKLYAANPTSGYATMRVKAKSVANLALPAALKMKIGTVSYVGRDDFHAQTDVIQNSRQMVMKSVPLSQIMKEMNRNSNNYVANLLFQFLGGADGFEKFATKILRTEPSEVQFVNGSGDRLDLADGKAAYNKASCDAIVKTIAQFRETLQAQSSQLEQIMALAGEDPSSHEESTVSKMYGNEATTDALIAKTGTVDPTVTLAGMASTEDGDVYFGIMYGTNGRKSDWIDGRNKIRKDVIELFKKFGNKKEIDYDPSQFLAFDHASHLRDVDSSSAQVADKSDQAQDSQQSKLKKTSPPVVDNTDISYDDMSYGTVRRVRLP